MQRQNQQIPSKSWALIAASALEQRTADQQRYEQQQRAIGATIQQINQELIETKRAENMVLQQQNKQVYFERDS